MQNNTSIIILAAGKGTRMKSETSKLLHKIGNLELVNHVILTSQKLCPQEIVLVISEENKTEIINNLDKNIKTTIQYERLGTAHATKVGLESIKYLDNNILIIFGDTPLIKIETYQLMINMLNKNNNSIVVLGFDVNDINQKYGRLIVKDNNLEQIIEYKDANENQRNLKLCNAGIMAVKGHFLKDFLEKTTNNNASKEYYLTEIIEIAKKQKLNCSFIKVDEEEVIGVNSKEDLAKTEEIFQNNKRKEFMFNGVTLLDPKSVYFSYDTQIENDVTIEQNVIFLPKVKIASNCHIKAFSYLEGCELKNNVSIGPFARIRPDSFLEENVQIGNFVEIKKSNIEKNVKIGHLTYIGDSEIGENTNIGAGTITCNYNGYNKFKTKIGKNNFVGSNTIFIAPINTEDNCLTAAGSVITKNIKKNEIVISRSDQKNIKDGFLRYKNKFEKK